MSNFWGAYQVHVLMLVSTSHSFLCLRTPKFSTQLKFVQTTAEVCTDFAVVCRVGNAGFIFSLCLSANFNALKLP